MIDIVKNVFYIKLMVKNDLKLIYEDNESVGDKNGMNLGNVIKKYLLIFFTFIIISHPEFDILVNLDNMNILYNKLLKGLLFIVIQIIYNIIL